MAVTLTDMLAAAAIVAPLLCSGIYLAIRIAIRGVIAELRLEASEKYVTKEACRHIRDECARHLEHWREQA